MASTRSRSRGDLRPSLSVSTCCFVTMYARILKHVAPSFYAGVLDGATFQTCRTRSHTRGALGRNPARRAPPARLRGPPGPGGTPQLSLGPGRSMPPFLHTAPVVLSCAFCQGARTPAYRMRQLSRRGFGMAHFIEGTRPENQKRTGRATMGLCHVRCSCTALLHLRSTSSRPWCRRDPVALRMGFRRVRTALRVQLARLGDGARVSILS